MPELIDFVKNVSQPIGWEEATVAMLFSTAAAIVTCLMYHVFYGSKNIGAGVQRMFLIGGPSITMLFLGIQTSIPLSLGLLGALSFVRFRTPVKDPAEIGFLLLLVATSIGSATKNYLSVILLYGILVLVLSCDMLLKNRFSLGGRGHLMISVDQPSFERVRTTLTDFLTDRLRGLRLQNISLLDGRISLQYHYRRKRGFDWTAFTSELKHLDDQAQIEVFAG